MSVADRRSFMTFRHLCDAIVDVSLLWKSFAQITTDGAPLMTGWRNGLVAFIQRKLEEESVENTQSNFSNFC